MAKREDIIAALEEYAPLELAEAGDNCGMQVEGKEDVSKISLILDPSIEMLKKCSGDFIFSHHPLFFIPIRSVENDVAIKLGMMIKKGQTLYSMHTCLDYSPKGVSWTLAELLGLEEDKYSTPQMRTGTMEYETLEELSSFVAKTLNVRIVKVVNGHAPIGRIALIPGSGFNPSTIEQCKEQGISVLISGDLKHHQAILAQDIGISLIDAGHRETEYPVLYKVAEHLEKTFPSIDTEVIIPENPWNYIKK